LWGSVYNLTTWLWGTKKLWGPFSLSPQRRPHKLLPGRVCIPKMHILRVPHKTAVLLVSAHTRTAQKFLYTLFCPLGVTYDVTLFWLAEVFLGRACADACH